MSLRLLPALYSAVACLLASDYSIAGGAADAVRLTYMETEEGIDPYRVTYTVTERFIRIDDESDNSGFIIFDIGDNKIYSITHHNRTTLVIPKHTAEESKSDLEINIEYRALDNAPRISGKTVFNYTVKTDAGELDETCMDIQLVPGLLPEVARALQAFQQVVSANQVSKLENTPEEFRKPCFLVGLVYNAGEYYSKGLPIQEWYSNGRRRQLMNFENVRIEESIFDLPEEYRQMTLGD